ncbi:MAG: SUMF1/EgtB/PvdO family nonheme iron enzyme [Lentisphaeria bacterium]|nr:SUMF1/EgtB/PvdO family nonheme iron enzyme [Lentisphaeria bacterium]
MFLQKDDKLGTYRLIAKCGSGACGEVWRAKAENGRLVALKIFPLDNGMGADEASGIQEYAKMPRQPNLIAVWDVQFVDGYCYYCMELADNMSPEADEYIPKSLDRVMANQKGMPAQEVAELAIQLLNGLQAIHDAGLVHRDIKPENVLFVNGVPKIADMGLMVQNNHFRTMGGTIGYIPPERLTGRVTGEYTNNDDLYAMGKIIYCLWSGNPAIMFPSVPDRCLESAMDAGINRVLGIACNTHHNHRFKSASAFAEALRNYVKKVPAGTRTGGKAGGGLRRKLLSWGLLLMALGIMAFAGAYMLHWPGEYDSKSEGVEQKDVENAGVPRNDAKGWTPLMKNDSGNSVTVSKTTTDGQTEVVAKTLSGSGVNEALPNGGPYAATWDFAADCPGVVPTNMAVDAKAMAGNYLVVDLETGSHRYTMSAPDLSDDTCRTTELWLRRIPAGTFMMGSPENEVGRSGDEPLHAVTLTEDYYIGVFEVTQKQYDLLCPNNMSDCKGDCRPVDNISYDIIRGTKKKEGAGWPLYGHAVDEMSFLGTLRSRTGLVFDLPTEAQWEYACRAGAATALNTGRNLMVSEHDSSMNEAGRYGGNRSDGMGGYGEHTKVGSYLPNAWGLYDMHGNVGEWCLDRYGEYDLSMRNDPVGAMTGNGRVIRGGTWNAFYVYAGNCRSAARGQDTSERPLNIWGFRVVCLPSVSLTRHKLSVNGEESQCLEGDMITINAPVKSGYLFKEWVAKGVTLSDTESQLTAFRMPANDVKLTASYEPPPALENTLYLVVNLIDGSLRCTDTAPDLSDDTCRTTELWLRRIPAGTFIMGSPEYEVGRKENEKQHKVTISNDYYIGVFETTQRQWKLVMGTDPSCRKGDCRPVETVTYDSVADAFMRKISAKTHLFFSLPSEAQWEYACRAGTATSLNSGTNLTGTGMDSELSKIARYLFNNRDGKGGYEVTTKVGMYPPNAWGLYDMHGNVAEWCGDWYAEYPDAATPATDPEGPRHGTIHVRRGGCSEDTALKCRSAFRAVDGDPPGGDGGRGFRVMVQPAAPCHSVVVNGEMQGKIYENEELAITPEIPEGAAFAEWIPEGVFLNEKQRHANPVSFAMPANDVTLTAEYEKIHRIAVKDIHASRHPSGNDLVDIVYSVDCDLVDAQGNPAEIFMDFALVNNDTKETFKIALVTGDGADAPITTGGPYAVVWDKRNDLPEISGDSFSVVVSARAMLPTQPIPGDPVVYLPLSDSTASAAETGQPLSYYGKPTSTIVEGIPCTYFDGKSAIYNSQCSFIPAMASCTVSAWVRMSFDMADTPVCELGIWEGWNSAFIDIFTPVIRPGKVCVYTKHSDNTDGDLPYEEWHHVLVWGSRLSAGVYVDGAYAASNEEEEDNFLEARMEPIRTSFVIGSNRNREKPYGRDGFWRGHIASFRVYDRILKQSEINALACEFRPAELLDEGMSAPLELKASTILPTVNAVETQR